MATDRDRDAGQRGLLLWGGLFGLAIAAGALLLLLWGRLDSLESKLDAAQAREQRLEAEAAEAELRAGKAAAEADQAKDRAFEAESEASEEDRARSRAEWERQLAHEVAGRAGRERDEAEAEARERESELNHLRNLRKQELERMREALAAIVETERTPLGMVMRLGEDRLRFDFDKATIREDDKELLSRIAGVLLASHGFQLSIHGHTDDVGPASYNQGLSERRAESVLSYFKQAGLPPGIMAAKGYGETSPRVRGTTSEARQANRRVEIAIVDTVIDYGEDLDEDE